jgi:hypothetical protein
MILLSVYLAFSSVGGGLAKIPIVFWPCRSPAMALKLGSPLMIV